MTLSAHEEHWSCWQGGVERPSKAGLGESPAVGAAAEALREILTRISLAAVDLVVRAGQIHDRMPVVRIGKEALVNAFSHSGAKRVDLELKYSGTELQMWIRDNGRGMEPHVLEQGRDGHWGLAGMRERATRIGGRLEILSRTPTGTEIQLSVPLERSLHHRGSQ